VKLELRDELQEAWAGRDAFDEAASTRGTVYRQMDGRRTLRFQLRGRHYFLKYHAGVGWREVLKNLVQLKRPVLGAGVEWRAIEHLHRLGLATLEAVGYGEKGWNPAHRRSFLITRELAQTTSLEELVLDWPDHPPSPVLKRAIIARVAGIARRMHLGGINHRDFYVCHLLLDTSVGIAALRPESIRFYVVDLHRAQIRRRVPQRWLVKDLASLYYSMMHAGLTRRDLLRFIRVYSGEPLRTSLSRHRNLWQQVQRRATGFHWEFFGKPPPGH